MYFREVSCDFGDPVYCSAARLNSALSLNSKGQTHLAQASPWLVLNGTNMLVFALAGPPGSKSANVGQRMISTGN